MSLKPVFYSAYQISRFLRASVNEANLLLDKGVIRSAANAKGIRRVSAEELIEYLEARSMSVPPDLASRKKPRFTIVDDNEEQLKLYTQIMGKYYPSAGIEIVESGDKAAEAVEKYLPDIVLLDVNLPGIDGYEVCDRIRSSSSAGETVIIIVTGIMVREIKNSALLRGANEIIFKPIDYDELKHKIDRHLNT